MITEERAAYLAAMEREITKKYGKEAAANIRSTWDDEKEMSYIGQIAKEAVKEREYLRQKKEKLQRKALVTKQGQYCEVCKKMSFDAGIGIYVEKYGCCRRCYQTHVIGEEDRWEHKRKRLIKENI